jgi:transposase-like protein
VDDLVISLSAKGLTHGEIAAHLAEVYGADVSKQTITAITDRVMEGMADWQNRPLDAGRFLGVVANLGCSWLVPSSHELGRGAVGQA